MKIFSDFMSTFLKKNKNTSNTILEQVLNKFGSDIKLYERDNVVSTNSATVKLQPKGRTRRVGFAHKQYSDSHACAPPKTVLHYKKIKTWNENNLNINFKKIFTVCGRFCLSINYCTLLVPLGSKTAMLIWY